MAVSKKKNYAADKIFWSINKAIRWKNVLKHSSVLKIIFFRLSDETNVARNQICLCVDIVKKSFYFNAADKTFLVFALNS